MCTIYSQYKNTHAKDSEHSVVYRLFGIQSDGSVEDFCYRKHNHQLYDECEKLFLSREYLDTAFSSENDRAENLNTIGGTKNEGHRPNV